MLEYYELIEQACQTGNKPPCQKITKAQELEKL